MAIICRKKRGSRQTSSCRVSAQGAWASGAQLAHKDISLAQHRHSSMTQGNHPQQHRMARAAHVSTQTGIHHCLLLFLVAAVRPAPCASGSTRVIKSHSFGYNLYITVTLAVVAHLCEAAWLKHGWDQEDVSSCVNEVTQWLVVLKHKPSILCSSSSTPTAQHKTRT
jgi:hypothetical protein